MIQEIITLLRTNTAYKYYFDGAPKVEDCIVYNYYTSVNDGITKISRLTLHIITKGIDENAIIRAEEMKSVINGQLITIADNELSNTIMNVVQNGGGDMTDECTKTTHQILYYDITERG